MINTEKKGLLIVFEGTDGTGKSTQLNLLDKFLKERGYPVVATREPTDGKYGQKIRQLYENRNQCSRKD
jgi:dTMP kinase